MTKRRKHGLREEQSTAGLQRAGGEGIKEGETDKGASDEHHLPHLEPVSKHQHCRQVTAKPLAEHPSLPLLSPHFLWQTSPSFSFNLLTKSTNAAEVSFMGEMALCLFLGVTVEFYVLNLHWTEC